MINAIKRLFGIKQYKAVHCDTCEGCAFEKRGPFGCTAKPEMCSRQFRKDGKSVIFVEVK